MSDQASCPYCNEQLDICPVRDPLNDCPGGMLAGYDVYECSCGFSCRPSELPRIWAERLIQEQRSRIEPNPAAEALWSYLTTEPVTLASFAALAQLRLESLYPGEVRD